MRKREDRAIAKHTINLFAGDLAKLQRFYPTRIGAGKIIRDIVHAHIRAIEESAAQNLPPKTLEEVEMEGHVRDI